MNRLLRDERGEGRFGTFVGIAIIAVSIYLGIKVIPVLIDGYAFRDYLKEEARFAALRNKDDEVRERVLRKAREMELPVKPAQVSVSRAGTFFEIKVKYDVPIETPVYTYDMAYDEQIRAPLF